jgi:hypothetical protein
VAALHMPFVAEVVFREVAEAPQARRMVAKAEVAAAVEIIEGEDAVKRPHTYHLPNGTP